MQKEYQEIADQQWTVVRDEYFTATGRCAIKTQTGLTLALKYHLSENETMTAEMLKAVPTEQVQVKYWICWHTTFV